jgi:hypothetical protein
LQQHLPHCRRSWNSAIVRLRWRDTKERDTIALSRGATAGWWARRHRLREKSHQM